MKPKIFVSSLISSMAPFRAAAQDAIEQLESLTVSFFART